MSDPRSMILDLFAGTGSATLPFRECGKHTVVGVDIVPGPYVEIVCDVRNLPRWVREAKWDFVWASPPCQEYSYVRTFNRHTFTRYDYHPDLSCWQAAIDMDADVIENVLGAQRTWGPPDVRFGPWCMWTDLKVEPTGPVPGKGRLIWRPEISRTQRRSSDIPRPLANVFHRAVCEP